MPETPRAPSADNAPEHRLAQAQGGERPGPSHFGVDYDHPPARDASNHLTELTTAHEGRPTVAEQMHTHGAAPPRTPEVGGRG